MKSLFVILTAVCIFHFSCQTSKQQNEATDDPYLWLEEIESEKALQWVEEKNKVIEEFIVNSSVYLRDIAFEYAFIFNALGIEQ